MGAKAGWYPHPTMADTVRYSDGDAWTDHIAPATGAAAAPAAADGATVPCPYCASMIPAAALRCSACAGELRHCSRCGTMRGTTSHQKFVGIARGGMKTQYRCMVCNKVLDGPRF